MRFGSVSSFPAGCSRGSSSTTIHMPFGILSSSSAPSFPPRSPIFHSALPLRIIRRSSCVFRGWFLRRCLWVSSARRYEFFFLKKLRFVHWLCESKWVRGLLRFYRKRSVRLRCGSMALFFTFLYGPYWSLCRDCPLPNALLSCFNLQIHCTFHG